MKRRGISSLIAFCVTFSLLSGTVSASNIGGVEFRERVPTVSENEVERTAEDAVDESAEAVAASLEEEEEEISALFDIGSSATGITWTVDGDTVTFSGESARGDLSSDFWNTLKRAKHIKFESCKITGSMDRFFENTVAESIDCSGLDTSGVTNMAYMFNFCPSLTSLNMSGFDTSNVTNMAYMFDACKSLTSLDVSGFDTSNVTNMAYMFNFCPSLTSLDMSGFDTSNVTNMGNMFSNCDSLTSLDVSSFDTSNVTNMYSMFGDCDSLTSLDMSSFDTSNVTNMVGMFIACESLTSLDVSSFDTSNVTNMEGMFVGCESLTSLDVSGFDTSNVTNMGFMFGCESLTSLDVSSFDTSNVTNMETMFGGCKSLTSLDMSGFDTSNVTNMAYMFRGCYSLTSLDVSSFDTSNVTNMRVMFGECPSLTSLDMSGFDTSNVTNMEFMFYDCPSLTSLDVSSFDTSNVTNMEAMFSFCLNLASLKTPRTLGVSSVELPAIFVDPRGRETNKVTAEFLSTTLTRKSDASDPTPTPPSPPALEHLILTGRITGHQGMVYKSVTARLVGLNGESYSATVSGADGLDGTDKKACTYFVAAPAGQYSLEVEAETEEGVTVNRSAMVKLSGSGQTKDINLPNGQAKLKVNAKNEAKVLVGGLDSLILSDNGTMLDGASTAEVTFTVDSADSLKEKEEAVAIQSSAPAQKMEFYDFSITKTVNSIESEVTDTEGAAVMIVLPFEKKGKGNIKVYRYHGGEVDTLTERETDGEKIEVGAESITIYAKKFSMYAVGYTVSTDSTDSDSDNNSGNNTGSTSNNNSGNNTGSTSNNNSGNNTGSTSDNNSGNNTGSTSDNNSSNNTGDANNNNSSNNTGNTSNNNSSTNNTDSSGEGDSGVFGGSQLSVRPIASAESNSFLKPQPVDWKNVLSKVNVAQNDENINILTGAGFTVPKEVVQALAGTDKTLALHLGHGTAISFSGRNLRKTDAALGFTFTETADIPETAKRGIGIVQGAGTVRKLTIEAGNFPYLAGIHFALGAENVGKTAYLYRYDAKTGKLSQVGRFRITAQGQAMFALKNDGSYLMAVSGGTTGSVYTVVRGDSLYKIAKRHGISLRALLAANPQNKNKQIYPGQTLQIPVK